MTDNALTRVPVYTSEPDDPVGSGDAPPWYARVGNRLLSFLDNFGYGAYEPDDPRVVRSKAARNRLLGISDEERPQFWPERMVRSGVTLAGDVATGNVPPPGLRREDLTDIPVDPDKIGGQPQDDLIQRVQDMAGLAMSGGIAGTGGQSGAVLGSAPTLRTAAKSAPVWYSPVEHALEQSTQGSAIGAQWLATIRNSRGVKPEELDWTGLRQFLEERADKPVSRPELHEYLRDNRVELRDVTKGQMTLEDLTRHREALALEDYGYSYRDLPEKYQRQVDEDISRRSNGDGTKYRSYQLPGGENYREHLITLPQKDPIHDPRYVDAKHRQRNGLDYDRDLVERVESMRAPEQGDYHSPHWDEPNIVAHVRSNVREMHGPEGKPLQSLHLEEVQSDWHQAGRRKGYKLDEAEIAERRKLQDRWIEEGDKLPDADKRRLSELMAREKGGEVPDAPWKKTWHELALRRMIRLAAEEGMDRISWTPGEAQAARYDLSKQIDTIELRRSSQDAERGLLIAKGKQGQSVLDKKVDLKELPDLIGKEAADKLLKQEYNQTHASGTGHQKLENADLKVGGEGMRGFYDKMMVQAVEKLGREYGVKVVKEKLPGQGNPPDDFMRGGLRPRTRGEREEAWRREGGPEVWYFDIPPAMREAALSRGMPLFSGGKMFVPAGTQERSER